MIGVLAQLALLFVTLSLLAVGGGNGVLPEMRHVAVDVQHWMTNREFLEAFAISRAAPGPASLIVVLVGQKAAGLAGAVVAAVAMYTPSSMLVYAATYVWQRTEGQRWRHWMESALIPLAVGLTFGSGLALARSMEHGRSAFVLTALSAIVLALTEIHPLLVMGSGALLGAWLGI